MKKNVTFNSLCPRPSLLRSPPIVSQKVEISTKLCISRGCPGLSNMVNRDITQHQLCVIRKAEGIQSLPYELTRATTLGSVGCSLCLVQTLFCVSEGPQRPSLRTWSRGKERKRERERSLGFTAAGSSQS